MIAAWTRFWDRHEAPYALAAVRVVLPWVLLADLFVVWRLDLVEVLWAPHAHGGMLTIDRMNALPHAYRLLPESASTAWLLYGAAITTLLSFSAGLFTRTSGLLFVLTSAQLALINDPGDRAIDRMCRIVILVLSLSAAGQVWSVDAWRKTGSFRGDPTPAPAWPRWLLVVQLVVMYWTAGVAKAAVTWFPWGGYQALFQILQDPVLARHDFSWLHFGPAFFLTQVATAVTHLWEWTFPALLLFYFYEETADRPGRVRALCNRARARYAFIAIGAVFHLALWGSLRLGIFPPAMLAMYPLFFYPEELAALGRRLFGGGKDPA